MRQIKLKSQSKGKYIVKKVKGVYKIYDKELKQFKS